MTFGEERWRFVEYLPLGRTVVYTLVAQMVDPGDAWACACAHYGKT